jgi:O-antigen ligase
VLTLGFLGASRLRTRKYSTIIILILCIGATAYAAFYAESETSIHPISRIGIAAEDSGSILRLEMMRDATTQYLDNPILGSATVEVRSRTYPHNILVEAFMATGTFGGLLTLCLIAVSLRASWVLVRSAACGWVALVFVQYLIADLLSGSLFLAERLWYYSIGVAVLSAGYVSEVRAAKAAGPSILKRKTQILRVMGRGAGANSHLDIGVRDL